MLKNKRAFTLIEMIITIAIASILLLLATDKFIIGAFTAGNNYNQRVDLQSGVKSSMDNIKSVLKKSVQVHLVGKEVYYPGMDLSKLDERYNYIAFHEDTNGNKFLANFVYNKKDKKFEVIPLTSSDKNDILNNNNISYNLEFYKDDSKYKEKLDKDMLSFTVSGKSTVTSAGGQDAEFELKEDLLLPNVNQILISRHLKGGIEDITAIAYDDGLFRPGQKGDNKVGIVFIVDNSGSMKKNIDGFYPFYEADKDKFWVDAKEVENRKHYTEQELINGCYASPRKVIVGNSVSNVFIPKIHSLASDKKLDVSAFIYQYNTDVKYTNIYKPDDNSQEYFYNFEELKKDGYGPYKLEDNTQAELAKAHVKNNCGMNLGDKKDYEVNYQPGGTNTGMALMQALEILHQLKKQGINHRFLILLSDGVPTFYSVYDEYKDIPNKKYMVNREVYNSLHLKKYTIEVQWGGKSMEYVKAVGDPSRGLNENGLYKGYLIGFSGVADEVSMMGITEPIDAAPPTDSIRAYLSKSGNEILAFRAKNDKELDKIFESIISDIAVDIAVFDGPNKAKK